MTNATPAPKKKRRFWSMERKQSAAGWAFLTPATLMIFVFSFYPMVQAFLTSLKRGLPTALTYCDPLWRNYQRMLSDKGIRRKMKMPMWYAMVMEELGEVDCTFCGHTNTTGDVLMCAQMTIGLAEGVDVPSILALVDTPGFEGPEGSVICFTDCGLNPEPNASELASIAISAADGVQSIMGWEPRVGFLSFSTDGSGAGQSVERVDEAIKLVHERRPELAADGEFQLDAAIDPAVAAKKVGRESDVAGRANVLVFPDLNAANIAVKLIQRFAKGAAYGHTLNGFKRPVADSSRGATVEEIVGDVAMLVLSAR